jgi:hypothetical protein
MVEVVGKDTRNMKEITCSHCSSVLRYNPVDIKTGKVSDPWDHRMCAETVEYRFIICPSCTNQVGIK